MGHSWEFVLTFPDVELALITKRLRFRWVFVSSKYLCPRYELILGMVWFHRFLI